MNRADDPSAARTFDVPGLRVFAVDGDPDVLALYDPTTPTASLVMRDPIDLRDYR